MEGIHKFRLAMMIDGNIVVVARGSVDFDITMLYNTPISPGYAPACVDSVVPSRSHLLLPVPTGEFDTIGLTIGFYVLWPRY